MKRILLFFVLSALPLAGSATAFSPSCPAAVTVAMSASGPATAAEATAAEEAAVEATAVEASAVEEAAAEEAAVEETAVEETVEPAAATVAAPFTVDERFELAGIAARLAGYYEYSRGTIPEYDAAINGYFSPHRFHKLINHLKNIRVSNSIGYDAIPSATRLLVIKDGGISLNPEADVKKLCENDPRWTEEAFARFVEYMDDFYRKTDFHRFFEENSALYRKGEELVNGFAEVDTSWFRSFYGRPLKSPELYISFVNGPSNYALTDSGTVPGFGILMGLWFDPNTVTLENISVQQRCGFTDVIIHELCHNFTNPITGKYMKELAGASDIIFFEDDVCASMSEIAYGDPSIMTHEWLNNLCEMMYFREKGLLYPEEYGLIGSYESDAYGYSAFVTAYKGFFWFNSTIELMDKFYGHRDKYPYFEDFMPEIVRFYKKFSKDIMSEREKYEALYPRITGFAVDSSAADTVKLRFTFSVPMNPRYFDSRIYPSGYGGSDVQPPTGTVAVGFEGDRTFTVSFAKGNFEKGRTYGGLVNGFGFRSMRQYAMMENYPFEFVYE